MASRSVTSTLAASGSVSLYPAATAAQALREGGKLVESATFADGLASAASTLAAHRVGVLEFGGDGGIGLARRPASCRGSRWLCRWPRAARPALLAASGSVRLEFGGDGGIGPRQGGKLAGVGGFADGLAQRGQLFGGVGPGVEFGGDGGIGLCHGAASW